MWGYKVFEMWLVCLFFFFMIVEIFCFLFKSVCVLGVCFWRGWGRMRKGKLIVLFFC